MAAKNRRNVKCGRDDAAAGGFFEACRKIRELVVEAAACARRLIEVGHPMDEGAASLEEFAERNGACAAPFARMLARVGEALERCPGLDSYIRDGRTTPEHVSEFLAILRDPLKFLRDDDDWEEWLRGLNCHDFRRLVRRRLAEARGQGVLKQIYMTEAGAEMLERVRTILSRKKGTMVSLGEAAATSAADWLKRHDRLEKKPGKRRKGDTTGDPSRHVPTDVQLELMAEHRDRCPIRFCIKWIWLENAHDEPHSHGGSREFRNLRRPCSTHHTEWDAGLLKIRGRRGATVVRNRYGQDLNAPRPAPDGWRLDESHHPAFRSKLGDLPDTG